MTISGHSASLDAAREFMNRALDAPNGIHIHFPTEREAKALRVAMGHAKAHMRRFVAEGEAPTTARDLNVRRIEWDKLVTEITHVPDLGDAPWRFTIRKLDLSHLLVTEF